MAPWPFSAGRVKITERSYTYRPSVRELEIIPGDTHAAVVASLGRTAFSDLRKRPRGK